MHTIKDLADKFLYYERVGIGKSEHTINSYENDLNQFISYITEYESIKNLENMDKKVFRSFMAFLSRNGVSKRSINRKISAIRSFFRYLLKHKYISKDYSVLISTPKFDKKVPSIISNIELDMIRDVIDVKTFIGIRDRAMIELLFSSGIRASELLDMRENLINFDDRELRIIGKGEKERITFFSNTAKEWVLHYIKERDINFDTSNEGFFVNAKGKTLSDRSLRRIIKDYAQKAGIEKDVSPHTFRHSFASYLLNNGINIRYLQELLGHSSITTTQSYTHVGKKFLKEVYLKTHPYSNK